MIIKKGTHAPFRLPKLLFNPQALRYEVEFTESCRYRFGTDDDADVNKLFGIAFITLGSFWFIIKNLFKGKVKALHHYNSIRWGWRYDALSNRFELLEYCYENGLRSIKYDHSVPFHDIYCKSPRTFLDWIKISDSEWSTFDAGAVIEFNYTPPKMPNTWICYELHPYFGGNRTAPHDMEIKMKRL